MVIFKRTWLRYSILFRYWFAKRWKVLYCCVALVCFAFILISNKNEKFSSIQITDARPSTISLRQNLTASNEQNARTIKSSKKDESISDRLNNLILNSFSRINDYYTGKLSNLIAKNEFDSNLLTLFISPKFKKLNQPNFNPDQPIHQMNINQELESQLNSVIRRTIDYAERTYLLTKKPINRNNQTINLIKQMTNNQIDSDQMNASYTDHWQPVIGPRDKSRVYSAYYEHRLKDTRIVRLIAAARTGSTESLFCAFWYIEKNDRLKLLITPATKREIKENWNLFYTAQFLLCSLGEHDVPIGVSILKRKSNVEHNEIELNKANSDKFVFHALGNFVLVQNNLKYKENERKSSKLAVCVKPLHYDYNKLDSMIEFIELNRILGIDHFFFYNHSIGSKVECLLNSYIKNTDLITMLPWSNLDMKTQTEIRTEGIFASLNDCVYRTMYRYDYVVMIDFDEFIIPNMDDNLLSLIDRLTKNAQSTERIGAFIFRNGFFYSQWADDAKYSKLTKLDDGQQSPVYLTTLAKTRRRSDLHKYRTRSKLILKPEATIEAGNHFIWQFLPDKSSFHINEKAGYLHHYRVCEYGGEGCLSSNSIIDSRAHHWSKELIQKSISIFEVYNRTCVV